jgi:hypothetical protein
MANWSRDARVVASRLPCKHSGQTTTWQQALALGESSVGRLRCNACLCKATLDMTATLSDARPIRLQRMVKSNTHCWLFTGLTFRAICALTALGYATAALQAASEAGNSLDLLECHLYTACRP